MYRILSYDMHTLYYMRHCYKHVLYYKYDMCNSYVMIYCYKQVLNFYDSGTLL